MVYVPVLIVLHRWGGWVVDRGNELISLNFQQFAEGVYENLPLCNASITFDNYGGDPSPGANHVNRHLFPQSQLAVTPPVSQ